MPALLLRHYTEPGLILQDGSSVHGLALVYDSGSPSNSIAPAISLQGQGVTLSSLRIQNPYDAITTPSSATPGRARLSDIFIVQPKNVGVNISKAYDFLQCHHIEVWCNSFVPTGSAFRFGRIDGGTFNGLVAFPGPHRRGNLHRHRCRRRHLLWQPAELLRRPVQHGRHHNRNHTVNITAGDWDCHNYGAVIDGTSAQVTISGGKWHVNSAQAMKINHGANVVISACMFYRSATASVPFVWAANCATVTVNACQFLYRQHRPAARQQGPARRHHRQQLRGRRNHQQHDLRQTSYRQQPPAVAVARISPWTGRTTLSALTIGVSLRASQAAPPPRSPAKHPMWMRSEP